MTRKSDLFTLQAGLTADSRQNYEGQDWLEAEVYLAYLEWYINAYLPYIR